MASVLISGAWLVGKPVLSIQPGLLNKSLRMIQDKRDVEFVDCYEFTIEQNIDRLSTLKEIKGDLPVHWIGIKSSL